MALTEEKGGVGILKEMPHCTRNNIPFLRDKRVSLRDQLQVSVVVSGVNTKKEKTEGTLYNLAKRWNVCLETAKRTLLKTTERRLRTSGNPLLFQWYNINDRILRYMRLSVDLIMKLLSQGLFHTGEIYMPKFMPT